jgi:hypothetical protein
LEDVVTAVMRKVSLVVMLLSTAAFAEGIDGLGRISIGGGFRWVPNWWFTERAAEFGAPVLPGLTGGPQANASFGLGVSPVMELTIDLLGSFETITLQLPDGNRDEITSAMYGAMLGGRLSSTNVFFKGFMPYLQVQAGPLLSNVSSKAFPTPERVLLAVSASGGATWRFSDRYGITLDARYVLARSAVSGVSGLNVGGVLFSAMFTIFFPPPPKRDLDVPGF